MADPSVEQLAGLDSYRYPAPHRWQAVVVDWRTGQAIEEITDARSRRYSKALNAAASWNFTIPGDDPQALVLSELAVDVAVYRDGRPMMRGRLGSSQDQGTENVLTSQFAVLGYESILNRRHFLAPTSYTQQDQSLIAWDFVQQAQARTGGALGITRGYGVGVGGQPLRDRSYDVGKPIGEALVQLSQVIGGFDFEVDPGLRFNLYYPQRGRDTQQLLSWGSQVQRFQRSWTADDFGNVVVATGAEGLAPLVLEASDLATQPQGRFEVPFGDPDISIASTLQEQAAQALEDAQLPVGAYTLLLAPGVYGPLMYEVGDTFTLAIDRGRFNFSVQGRILQIDVAVGDDGDEAVTFTVGRLPASFEQTQLSYDRRLQRVERNS